MANDRKWDSAICHPRSLPELRLHLRPLGDVLFQVEITGAAVFQERLLEAFDLGAGVGEACGDFDRDDADAMLIGMDQVAGADLDPGEMDRLAEIDQAN